jgi:hypothetical protein
VTTGRPETSADLLKLRCPLTLPCLQNREQLLRYATKEGQYVRSNASGNLLGASVPVETGVNAYGRMEMRVGSHNSAWTPRVPFKRSRPLSPDPNAQVQQPIAPIEPERFQWAHVEMDNLLLNIVGACKHASTGQVSWRAAMTEWNSRSNERVAQTSTLKNRSARVLFRNILHHFIRKRTDTICITLRFVRNWTGMTCSSHE